MNPLEAEDLALAVAGRALCTGLSVRFEAGENWAVLGANGSGKTTLLHTLAGLRPPDRGVVRLDGRDIRLTPHRERARRLGVLFQDYDTTLPATVMEIVLTGRHPHLGRLEWEGDEDRRLAEAALAAVGLAGFGPRQVATLSGGERRRAEIAALLTQDAPILLLDEPTNHLDLHHQIESLERLAARAARPGALNLFVLHEINLAVRFCTHGILLLGGGDHRCGRLGDILDRDTIERAYRCRVRVVRDGGNAFYLPG